MLGQSKRHLVNGRISDRSCVRGTVDSGVSPPQRLLQTSHRDEASRGLLASCGETTLREKRSSQALRRQSQDQSANPAPESVPPNLQSRHRVPQERSCRLILQKPCQIKSKGIRKFSWKVFAVIFHARMLRFLTIAVRSVIGDAHQEPIVDRSLTSAIFFERLARIRCSDEGFSLLSLNLFLPENSPPLVDSRIQLLNSVLQKNCTHSACPDLLGGHYATLGIGVVQRRHQQLTAPIFPSVRDG